MNHLHSPKKEKKLHRYLGLSYITAGAVFLFDPYVSVIDLLPDALGYLFILLGLYRMADLDDRLAEAMKSARNLALVGLARVVAMCSFSWRCSRWPCWIASCWYPCGKNFAAVCSIWAPATMPP